jgi:hypothetical protein
MNILPGNEPGASLHSHRYGKLKSHSFWNWHLLFSSKGRLNTRASTRNSGVTKQRGTGGNNNLRENVGLSLPEEVVTKRKIGLARGRLEWRYLYKNWFTVGISSCD